MMKLVCDIFFQNERGTLHQHQSLCAFSCVSPFVELLHNGPYVRILSHFHRLAVDT